MGAHMLQMGFLKLLHGASMRENKEKYPCTFSTEPPYEVRSTPWLSEEELLKLKKCEAALDRLYNSGRFRLTLTYLLEELEQEPFQFFYELGNEAKWSGTSLSEVSLTVYEYFAPRCNGQKLKELLAADLLCSASASQIPKELRITDPRHKKVANALSAGAHQKVLIMEQNRKILLVDPHSPRDLWGRFQHRFFELR